MLCPVCKERHAFKRLDQWRRGSETEIFPQPVTPDAQETYERDYDDDHKVPCLDCIVR